MSLSPTDTPIDHITDHIIVTYSPQPTSYTGVVAMIVAEHHGIGVFDTGVEEFMPDALDSALDRLKGSVKDITAICSTHGHFDHSGGSRKLREASGAPTYFSDLDADLANFPPDVPLRGGERIRLGSLDFDVVATPGHTPGSVCFHEERLGLVIVGDAVQGSGSAANGLLPVYFDSGRDYRDGLRALLNLRPSVLVMGHPLEWSGLSHCVQRSDDCTALLRESLEASEVISMAVAETLPNAEGKDLPILRREVLAILVEHSLFSDFDPDGPIGASTDATLRSEYRDMGLEISLGNADDE